MNYMFNSFIECLLCAFFVLVLLQAQVVSVNQGPHGDTFRVFVVYESRAEIYAASGSDCLDDLLLKWRNCQPSR
jgi:hypothetical protein